MNGMQSSPPRSRSFWIVLRARPVSRATSTSVSRVSGSACFVSTRMRISKAMHCLEILRDAIHRPLRKGTVLRKARAIAPDKRRTITKILAKGAKASAAVATPSLQQGGLDCVHRGTSRRLIRACPE